MTEAESASKCWYAVQVRAGFEEAAREALLERVAREGKADDFGEVLVPTEEVVSLKKGAQKSRQHKLYPSYLFVEMALRADTWFLVRHTPRITGFVGGRDDDPLSTTPLTPGEIDAVKNRAREGTENPRRKVMYENGEHIRVKDGPFSDFNGTVENIDYEHNRLTVSVMVFGRSTPVELSFEQVEKM